MTLIVLTLLSLLNAGSVNIYLKPEAKVRDPYRISLGEISDIECSKDIDNGECTSLNYVQVLAVKGFVTKYEILQNLRNKGYKAIITGKSSRILHSQDGAIIRALTAAIIAYVKSTCRYKNPHVEVSILNSDKESVRDLKLNNGKITVSAPMWSGNSGNVHFFINNTNNNILANVVINAEFVVAKRDVSAFGKLTVNDLELSRGKINSNTYLRSINDALGYRTRCHFRAGTPLNSSCIEETPVISRGDLINVIVSVNGVTVKSPAQSLQNGKIGDLIRVRNIQTKSIIQATVTGAKTTEVNLF